MVLLINSIRYNGLYFIDLLMKNYLITGGAGFIGSNFIRHTLQSFKNISITNFDALTYAGNPENLTDLEHHFQYQFVLGDIRDINKLRGLFENQQFDAVIHFAAESHVDRSIQNPSEFILTNVIGTANLLNICLDFWNKLDNEKKESFRFLHISTDEVFGSLDKDDPPFTEKTAYSPNSPYAASKAAADHLARAYFQTYQFPAIITNCSNNYGPFQFPEKLIPLIILNAINGKTLPLYGDGKQIRDWLYVLDHCEALWKVLFSGLPGQTYNIGGNIQVTNLEIVNRICSILDDLIPGSPNQPHKNLITFVNDRPGHDRRYAMDTSKIKSAIGWQPRFLLDEGLLETVKWYLDHLDWIENIGNKPSYEDWINLNYAKRGKRDK